MEKQERGVVWVEGNTSVDEFLLSLGSGGENLTNTDR